MGWLIEPLQFTFMQTGLLATVLVGATCTVLGVYVVLRSMAFIGDAMAHTILPGLVAAYLLGLNLLGGAVVAGVATALGVGWLSRRGTLREDTAIGVIFTGMFALGISASLTPLRATSVGVRRRNRPRSRLDKGGSRAGVQKKPQTPQPASSERSSRPS